MSEQDVKNPGEQGISKLKLAVGAASLFLFIIGVKRTFQMEQPEAAAEGSGREGKRAKSAEKKGKKGKRR